jgi:hypothetical protein
MSKIVEGKADPNHCVIMKGGGATRPLPQFLKTCGLPMTLSCGFVFFADWAGRGWGKLLFGEDRHFLLETFRRIGGGGGHEAKAGLSKIEGRAVASWQVEVLGTQPSPAK